MTIKNKKEVILMEYMTYEEYEEMKIQEAAQIAQGIINGEVKTIPFKIVMKQLDKQIKKIEKEQNRKELKHINKGGIQYTI